MEKNRDEIRKKILKHLYDIYFKTPYAHSTRDDLISVLKIPEKELDANMLYLEEKGRVTLFKALGSVFISARLTASGVDYVEENNLS